MADPAKPTVLVIGVGNALRGDDAAGAMAAQLLRERHLPWLHAIEHGGEGISLMETWTGAQTVIVVDAISSDAAPGTISRFDVTQQPLQGSLFRDSTHAFGLQEAVELSRALNRLPARLIIWGIAGKSFAIGEPLSAEVQAAVREVVDNILEELSGKA